MFCPLKIETSEGVSIWEENKSNFALAHRPLAVQLGKETTENLRSIQLFNEDFEKLANGVTIEVCDNSFPFQIKCSGGMWDCKASNIMFSIRGAYCDLCVYSKGTRASLTKESALTEIYNLARIFTVT